MPSIYVKVKLGVGQGLLKMWSDNYIQACEMKKEKKKYGHFV